MEDKKRIPVCNKDGEEIGAVYCPTDAAALNRCVEGVARFKKATALLIRININPDGTTDKSGRFIIHNAEKKIYELFDYILGYEGASDAFFSAVRPKVGRVSVVISATVSSQVLPPAGPP